MCSQDVRITKTGMLKSFPATRFRSIFHQFYSPGPPLNAGQHSRICIELSLYDTASLKLDTFSFMTHKLDGDSFQDASYINTFRIMSVARCITLKGLIMSVFVKEEGRPGRSWSA